MIVITERRSIWITVHTCFSDPPVSFSEFVLPATHFPYNRDISRTFRVYVYGKSLKINRKSNVPFNLMNNLWISNEVFQKDTADDHTHNSIHITPFLISAYFIQPLKIHIFFLFLQKHYFLLCPLFELIGDFLYSFDTTKRVDLVIDLGLLKSAKSEKEIRV